MPETLNLYAWVEMEEPTTLADLYNAIDAYEDFIARLKGAHYVAPDPDVDDLTEQLLKLCKTRLEAFRAQALAEEKAV